MKNRISTMKKTRFQSFQEFGEPITGTGLLLLAGIGGAVAWMVMRGGGARKVWFAEMITAKDEHFIAGIADSESDATAQLEETIRIGKIIANADHLTFPPFTTAVYRDGTPTRKGWTIWVKMPGYPSVPMVLYSTSDDAKNALVKLRTASPAELGPLSGSEFSVQVNKFPKHYVALTAAAGSFGLGGIALSGFSMISMPGSVPAAFYKFTNPEEIIP